MFDSGSRPGEGNSPGIIYSLKALGATSSVGISHPRRTFRHRARGRTRAAEADPGSHPLLVFGLSHGVYSSDDLFGRAILAERLDRRHRRLWLSSILGVGGIRRGEIAQRNSHAARTILCDSLRNWAKIATASRLEPMANRLEEIVRRKQALIDKAARERAEWHAFAAN